MSLTKKDLEHVIELANLEIDAKEKDQYLDKLLKVLENMDCINKLDLSNIKPSSWAAEIPTPFRNDQVIKTKNKFLEDNAPDWENNSFRVPKILHEQS